MLLQEDPGPLLFSPPLLFPKCSLLGGHFFFALHCSTFLCPSFLSFAITFALFHLQQDVGRVANSRQGLKVLDRPSATLLSLLEGLILWKRFCISRRVKRSMWCCIYEIDFRTSSSNVTKWSSLAHIDRPPQPQITHLIYLYLSHTTHARQCWKKW